jgi:histidinol-phosphate aminotransferase
MTAVPLDKLVPDFVRGFEPYVPSKPDDVLKRMYGCKSLHRLNNNENPLGPPPGAREVIEAFPPPRASLYPSGDAYHLRYKLGETFGVHPDQILVGNGANEVIAFVIKAFCQEGDNIVTADKTFAVYEWVAEFSGFEARLAPLRDHTFDAQALLDRIDDRTKVLFLCNPNNPTGTYWNEETLRYFMDQVGGQRIVVVDEAYFEFVDKPDFPNAMAMIPEYPNLVVFRTFSKMFALAGLRIGYLVGSPEVVDIIRRTCVVYSVNTVAQAAALAAVADTEHIQKTREMVSAGKAFLKRELGNLGMAPLVNEGNYLLVKLPLSDTLAYRKLMVHGVMVRTMTGLRFPNWIRITISHLEAMEALVEALDKVLRDPQ